jgi:hypothetical protein
LIGGDIVGGSRGVADNIERGGMKGIKTVHKQRCSNDK